MRAFYLGLFLNMTQNKKSNVKLTELFKKMSLSFSFLNKCFIDHFHFHQVFTIILLPSIYQPTMNNQFEALNAPKFRFLLFISHYLCKQTTSFFFN